MLSLYIEFLYLVYFSTKQECVCVNGVLVEGVQLIPTLHMSLHLYVNEH